jgi:CHAD domain-containing protein
MAHATTVNRDGLAGVLRQQVQALRHHLPHAGRGRPRAVHQARVASRRLREALPVAAAAVPGVDLRREVRRITKALGRVREIDVALTEFDRSTKVSGWSGAIAQRVREHLELERNRRERIMKARLNSLGGKRLDDRVKALARAVEERPPQPWRRALSMRLRKCARVFAESLTTVGTLYAIEPLHALRIAGKKLRYTLELARQANGAPVTREIAAMKRVQDVLGRMRDLQVLLAEIQRVAAAAHDLPTTRALDALAAGFEAECRDLHARFLVRRARLETLATRVARQAAMDLAVRRAVRVTHLRSTGGRRAVRTATRDGAAQPVGSFQENVNRSRMSS